MSLLPSRPKSPKPPRLATAALWCLLTGALWPGLRVDAQIVVENAQFAPYDPETLIREVFLGGGVEVLNIEYDGQRESLGYFEGGAASVGIERGVVLTTGHSASAGGNAGADGTSDQNAQYDNNSTVRDPNLERIVPYLDPTSGDVNILNVARYRITFRPKGDRVSFRYAFASDEYPQFVCSEFNDLFGFFISGPGFAGPYENGAENIALVPGTNLPVAINTVNGGIVGNNGDPSNCVLPDGSLANAAYYRDNTAPGNQPVYNGLTQVLTAEASVTPCEVYTIEITIGDVRDPAYDSGVFLEAESFETSILDVAVETPALGNEIAEGCSDGRITFTFSDDAATDRLVTFSTSGTATNGVDYDAIPSAVVVPAGQRSVSVDIRAIADGIDEGPETVTVRVDVDACTTRELTIRITDPIIEPVPPLRDTLVCPGEPVILDATLPMSLDNPKSFSNANPMVFFTSGTPISREIDVAGVDPNQLTAGALTEVCLDLDHKSAADLDVYLFSPAGRVLELTTDNGSGATNGQLCFRPDALVNIADPTAPFPWAGNYQPEGAWSDILHADDPVNGTWRLQVTDDANGGTGILRSWSMTFAARYDLTYAWTPPTGLSCDDCPVTEARPTATTTYTVRVRDSYGCAVDGQVELAVAPPLPQPNITCSGGFDFVEFSWPLDPTVSRYEVSTDGGASWVDRGLRTDTTVAGLAAGATVTLLVRATGPCGQATGSRSCQALVCAPITVGVATRAASCADGADGGATITASGGTAPYTYTLDGIGEPSGIFDNLAPGDYTAVVEDAIGCRQTATVTVSAPDPIVSDVTGPRRGLCRGPRRGLRVRGGRRGGRAGDDPRATQLRRRERTHGSGLPPPDGGALAGGLHPRPPGPPIGQQRRRRRRLRPRGGPRDGGLEADPAYRQRRRRGRLRGWRLRDDRPGGGRVDRPR